jgi:hypothetical protein
MMSLKTFRYIMWYVNKGMSHCFIDSASVPGERYKRVYDQSAISRTQTGKNIFRIIHAHRRECHHLILACHIWIKRNTRLPFEN